MRVAIKFVHAKNLILHTPMDDDDAQSSYILNVRTLGRKFFSWNKNQYVSRDKIFIQFIENNL